MTPEWPFEDPKNTAVFSTVGVMKKHEPICLVCHDEDGSWQFLSGALATMADAMLLSLSEVVSTDHTLGELTDLPLDWQATRENLHAPWQRSRKTAD